MQNLRYSLTEGQKIEPVVQINKDIMLTPGIPGSPTTAILLGGMVIWGLEPGPRLFFDHSNFVWPELPLCTQPTWRRY